MHARPRISAFVRARAVLGFLALAGCATPAPYAPRGPGQATGYTDRQLADNRWRVTFTGNSVTPRETVENDLLLRAGRGDFGSRAAAISCSTPAIPGPRPVTTPIPTGPGCGYGYGYWGFHPPLGL